MNDETTSARGAGPLIDIDAMNDRFRDYSLNTLNPIVTMMMSGAFATAALAFADIVRTPDLRWVRLSIWLWHAVFASTTIIAATSNNLLFVHPRPALIVYQLVFAFVLSAAFACLPLNTGGPDGWIVALASPVVLTGLFAGWIMPRFAEWMHPKYYPEELAPHLAERFAYYSRAKRVTVAFGLALSALVAAAIVTRGNSNIMNATIVVMNVLMSCGMVVASRSQTALHQRLIDTVERVRGERRSASA